MPYIKHEDRSSLDIRPMESAGRAQNAGELNYQITLLAIQFVKDHGLKYETLNAVVGAIESAKAEFQRRLVAPYEDTKVEQNGDVYPTLEELRA